MLSSILGKPSFNKLTYLKRCEKKTFLLMNFLKNFRTLLYLAVSLPILQKKNGISTGAGKIRH